MLATIERGTVIEFEYPAANYAGVRQRLEHRRLRIDQVRELAAQPLEAVTINMDPLLRRGATLLTGMDLDKRAERSFYLESMQGVHLAEVKERPGGSSRFRVMLFEADEGGAEPAFEADSIDEVLSWAEEWLKEPLGLAVAIQPPAVS